MAASPNVELNDASAPRSHWACATAEANCDDAREAFREVAASYWYCAYAWWRRAGLDAAHAVTRMAKASSTATSSPPT